MTTRCLFLLVWIAAAACAAPMPVPKEFVELKDYGYGWRAITSDDARLRVSDQTEPTEGGIEFWAETLRLDLVNQRGYEQVATGEVQNAAGTTGRWYQFAANVRGEKVGYLVAVWVVDPWWPLSSNFLRVAEFAARDEVFKARLEVVLASLSTVRG
jgi:hypothetical protein